MANNTRRNGRGEAASSGAPKWVVFMGGVVCGVLATVAVGVMLWPRTPGAADTAVASASPAKATVRDDITYEYPDVLRDSSVPVPEAASAATAIAPAAGEPAEAPQRVVLQAASFRSHEDAEALRAQLLLLDVGPVSTREVLVKDGQVWHRVLVGPFANAAAQQRAIAKLQKQNINAYAIAAPNDMPNAPTAPPRAPAAGVQPAAGRQPAAGAPSAASGAPAANRQPAANAQPAASTQRAASRQPEANAQPATRGQTAAQAQPSAPPHPTPRSQPSAPQQPPAPQQPQAGAPVRTSTASVAHDAARANN